MTDSLGVDVDTGEVIFTDDEMREMLTLAQNPPHPSEQPGFSFDREYEELDKLAVSGFLAFSDIEKTKFLNAVPADEAIFFLKWVDPHERDRLVGLLSDDQKRSLSSFSGDDDQVALSAQSEYR